MPIPRENDPEKIAQVIVTNVLRVPKMARERDHSTDTAAVCVIIENLITENVTVQAVMGRLQALKQAS